MMWLWCRSKSINTTSTHDKHDHLFFLAAEGHLADLIEPLFSARSTAKIDKYHFAERHAHDNRGEPTWTKRSTLSGPAVS
jgi:hypothetical protein